MRSGPWNSTRAALVASLVLAASLRLWGVMQGQLIQHPDEVFIALFPLNFFSGDLNPISFHYPTFYFYLVGLLYGTLFVGQIFFGPGWSPVEFAAYHYFWDLDSLLLLVRLMGVAFAVGTIVWTAHLAERVYGSRAGPMAGLALAVCTIHVRQSPLASVDVMMTFWFVGALWASVRLLERDEPWDYVLAGALVGLAGGTKYPGVSAGMAVAAAHLVSRRSLADRHIWIAGATAVGVFFAISPYVLLDFETFQQHFSYQAAHAARGRGEGGGWLYHLTFTLRHSLGWPGLGLGLVAIVQAIRRPRKETWVLLVGGLAFYLAVSWGRLTFVRYALPLMALQAVLAAGVVASLPERKWRFTLLLLLIVGPLYGSVRVAHLQGRRDTRLEARAWIERHVPSGASCCNFGGWAGDAPVRTIDDHWWRLKYFVRGFGHEKLKRSREFLEVNRSPTPFYRYAVQSGNRSYESGDTTLISIKRCSYAILHRHPLTYSTVDSNFAEQLKERGHVVARFTPEGLGRNNPLYDPVDAYFIPIGGFGELQQPGPEIEIWQIDQYPPGGETFQTARELFSAGYVTWAVTALNKNAIKETFQMVEHVLDLDAENVDGLLRLAEVLITMRRMPDALGVYQRIVERNPSRGEAFRGMALVHEELGDHEEAIRYYRRVLEIEPENADVHSDLGASYQALGAHEKAIAHWQRAIELDPDHADALHNIGMVHYMAGRYESAIEAWQDGIGLAPDNVKAHDNIAAAHRALGAHEEAIAHWQRAIELDPDHADALYNIGYTCQYDLGKPERSIPWWEKFLELRPDDADAHIRIANACSQVGETEKAESHFREVLERFPHHPQTAEIKKALEEQR